MDVKDTMNILMTLFCSFTFYVQSGGDAECVQSNIYSTLTSGRAVRLVIKYLGRYH